MERQPVVLYGKREPRLFEDTGISQNISNLIEPLAEKAGFKIIQVSLLGKEDLSLQILVERDDGTMTLRDCADFSRMISPILDVENMIGGKYSLEVSSPGIDRPMVWKSDFIRWKNHVVECKVAASSGDKERVVGKILEIGDTGFILEKKGSDLKREEELQISVRFDSLCAARLVITDELLRATLEANDSRCLVRD